MSWLESILTLFTFHFYLFNIAFERSLCFEMYNAIVFSILLTPNLWSKKMLYTHLTLFSLGTTNAVLLTLAVAEIAIIAGAFVSMYYITNNARRRLKITNVYRVLLDKSSATESDENIVIDLLNSGDVSAAYLFHNELTLFTHTENSNVDTDSLQNLFPESTVKLYEVTRTVDFARYLYSQAIGNGKLRYIHAHTPKDRRSELHRMSVNKCIEYVENTFNPPQKFDTMTDLYRLGRLYIDGKVFESNELHTFMKGIKNKEWPQFVYPSLIRYKKLGSNDEIPVPENSPDYINVN